MTYTRNPIVTEEHLQKFASNDYYVEAWQGKWKWNWGAFWLGGIFFLYRKMYLAFLAYAAVYLFFTVIYYDMDVIPLGYHLLFILLVHVPIACLSNTIYLSHAEKKIEKIIKANTDKSLQDYHIGKTGGFSFATPFLILFILPIYVFLMYVNLFE